MSRTASSPKLLIAGGAVVVASVAYAIGTQVSGGTAGAATKQAAQQPAQYPGTPVGTTGTTGPGGPWGHGPGGRDRRHGAFGPVLSAAAKELGVTEAQLRSALEDLRPDPAKLDHHDDLAASLATSLGVDAAAVTKALDAQRPTGPGPGPGGPRGARFDALAKELGLSAAKVKAAFQAVRPERLAQRGSQDGRDAFLTALAKELGVTKEKLATAIGTVGPGPGGPGGRHGFGPGGRHPFGPALDTAALAKALGVDEEKVTDALAAFRTAEQQEHAKDQAAFTKALADELNVPEARVTQVLGQFLRGPGRRP